MSKNAENWAANYELLKAYIQEHHHLPNKKKIENRGLLNWWKYNQKRLKQGSLDEDSAVKLKVLSDMRDM